MSANLSSGTIHNTTGPDEMAEATERPDLKLLQDELQYAWDQDEGAYQRTEWQEDIRYARWEGQDKDGLKHGRKGHPARPYERASDTRIMLADGVINELVDLLYAAFFGAQVQMAPTTASALSVKQAGEWRQVVRWMLRGPLRANLIDSVEFTAQVMLTIGWCVVHPNWRTEKIMRMTTLTKEDVQLLEERFKKEAPDSLAANIVAVMAGPDLGEGPSQAVELLRLLFPNLDEARAGRAVREFRASGVAEIPTVEDGPNVPEITVLVPGQHFVLPPEATATMDFARWMPVRMFFSEQALRQRAQEEGWNAAFVERAVATKGMSLTNQTVEHNEDDNLKLIEIFYMYQRRNNADGVPGMWCTIFSMFVNPATGKTKEGDYAKHWLVDAAHPLYQFILFQTEVTGLRPMDSRGVPETIHTQQNEIKNSRDAAFVYQQLSVTPPLQKKGTSASRLPPELGPLGIINNPSGGEWSWFPPPPGNPDLALKLGEMVRREAEDYHGLPRPETPPQRWQARQQRMVMRWLAKWGEVLWHLSVLAYQNLTPEELTVILGRPPLLNADMVAKHQLVLWFDVRTMDSSWIKEIITNMSQFVLPADLGGNVDRSKYVNLIMSYMFPMLAEEVTTDEAGASQKTFREVRDEMTAIMQGGEAIYVENDPTAKTKLKMAQQLVQQNQEWTAQLTPGNPNFSEPKRLKMDKFFKNLQQSAVQMVDNKVIGRLGVKPGPEEQG